MSDYFSEDNCRNSTMVMLTKQWIEAGGKAKYYDEMCNMLKEIYNYCNCKWEGKYECTERMFQVLCKFKNWYNEL